MTAAVQDLVSLSIAQGNRLDSTTSHDPKYHEMMHPMSSAVRQAGESNPALAYAQTVGQVLPREGFVDETNDAAVMFPFAPEVIAAARAEAARGITWRTGAAMISAAVSFGELYRGLLHGPFDALRFAVGIVFAALAVVLHRGRKDKPEPSADH